MSVAGYHETGTSAANDEGLVERFHTDGAVAVRGVLSGEWLQRLRDAIPTMLDTAISTGENVSGPARTQSAHFMWRTSEPFARFLFASPVGDTAARFMRSDTARLYEDLLLVQGAGADGTGWHRDAPHWPIKGYQLSSVWFSLERVTAETGAMRFVTGSHLDGDDRVDTTSTSASEAELGQRPTFTVEAEAGDVVVFHPRILHRTCGSALDRPRRTFTIRFAGDDVRWRPRTNYFHSWMADCGLGKGDLLEHPWFPVVAHR